MSAIQIEGLWQFIQTLMLSNRNKQWLADRLIESTYDSAPSEAAIHETEYILASEEMKKIIAEGDKQIASGSFKATKVSDLWK